MNGHEQSTQGPRDELLLSLRDLWQIIRKKKRMILLCGLILSFLSCMLTFQKGIVYEAEAMFREREKRGAGLSSSFTDLLGFGGRGGAQSEAEAMMQSRQVIEPIVRKHHLQASITDLGKKRGRLHRIYDHIKVQLAHLKRQKTPCLADPDPDLVCTSVEYQGECPTAALVTFINDHTFEVVSTKEEALGMGSLHERFESEDFAFTLAPRKDVSFEGRKFVVSMNPLATACKGLGGCIIFDEKDRKDASLLDIKFVYPDRHLAATLLNEVMDGYREYLHSDNERKAEIQLAYLEKRQKETNAELSTLLLEHADAVASDLGSKGFADTEKEMAFLTQALAEIKKRSLNIQLELSHIDQAIAAGTQAYERYLCGGEPQVIQQLLGSIRALRQQRDTLDFALYRQKGIQSIASSDDSLKMHLDELSRLQEGIDEVNMLRDCIRRGHSPSTSLKLVHLPNTWINQLFASTSTDTPPTSETKAMGREELEGYLSNLARVMQVQQDTVRKRLTYQKGSVTDYEGSDLPTVKALYLSCHTKLQELEALQRQYDFALTQLGDSTVDLSTCASVLTDPISREMITRAVDVQRLLQDDTTRSGKERERLEHQLELARSFLVQHIQQNLALSRENHQLLSEKLQVLREVTLDLLHQEISLQEKQFSDYLHSRREQLQHETELLTAREMELNQDLSALPRKWVSDRLVQQKLAQNQRVVEEITRLVESKNIAHNLEIIQSSPIDQAVAPILPRSSRVLLHAVTSLVFGSIIGLAFVIVRAIGSGMPATSNSMSMQGNRCLGQVPRRAPERAHPDELQTLRRICDFVLEKRIQGQGSSTVLCESSAPPFAAGIAHLLGQRGLKVVLIHLCGGPHTEKGFIPYLMGDADAPQALLENGYACIHAGQDSPFLHELLQSQRCTAYLAALKDAYDCVLIASRAKADSAECAAQIQLADRAILTIVDEKIDDTADFKRLEAQKPLGFVFARD